MLVYRIAGRKHAGDLSGTGAAMFGGRWNKVGTPVLYTGANQEIALLENLVHLPAGIAPKLDLLIIEIPDDSITEIKKTELPANWKDYPAPTVLSEIGQEWAESNESIALKVPSSIIDASHNYILNCQHPDYKKQVNLLHRENFSFDMRLLKS
jgi:RES domain-containing protein